MRQRLRILIVDDDPKKLGAIQSILKARLKWYELQAVEAHDYEEARHQLSTKSFDFVILDVMIPARGTKPSKDWSRALLMDIVGGELCFPMHVFGITQHAEIAEEERQFYNKQIFGFSQFSWESEVWAESVVNRIHYLASAVRNGAALRLNSFEYDVLIVTARAESEFKPIRKVLFGDEKSAEHPLIKSDYHLGTVSLSGNRALRVVLVCIGETGLSPASAIVMQSIQLFRPRLVAMLGMCAGFESNKVGIMDVLVARESMCWQEGKIGESAGKNSEEEFQYRAKNRNYSPVIGGLVSRQLEMRGDELATTLRDFSRRPDYQSLIAKVGAKEIPSIREGLIVSGSAVVASAKAVSEIHDMNPTALGLEMEIHGVYCAASMSIGRKPEYIAVKVSADLADRRKGSEAQALASELSAVIFLDLINGLKNDDFLFAGC